MKTILFRGQEVSTTDARSMIRELNEALSKADPIQADQPAPNEAIPVVFNPRWWSSLQPANGVLPEGHLITFLDAGLGWRGFFLPPQSASELVALMTRQLGVLAQRAVQGTSGQAVAPLVPSDAPLKH